MRLGFRVGSGLGLGFGVAVGAGVGGHPNLGQALLEARPAVQRRARMQRVDRAVLQGQLRLIGAGVGVGVQG